MPVPLSRRVFVLSGSAVLAASVLALLQAPASSSARAQKLTLPVTDAVEISILGITSYVFSPDFVTASPFSEVVGCAVSGAGSILSGATITVTFDARASAFTGQDAVLSGFEKSEFVLLPVVSAPGSLTFVLPVVSTESEQVVAQLAIPLSKTLAFPGENIAPVAPTVITVAPQSGNPTAFTDIAADSAATTGLAWGIELAPIWREVVVNKATAGTYSFPTFVKIVSVGPGPVAAGTIVTLTADAALLSDITITKIFVNDDPAVLSGAHRTQALVDGALVTTIVLTEPIAALGSLTVELVPTARAVAASISDISYCRVSVSPGGQRSPLQRVTGAETAVAVSNSGVPRAHNPVRVTS